MIAGIALAAVIGLVAAVGGLIAAVAWARSASKAEIAAVREQLAAERSRDLAVKARDTALADGVVDRRRAEDALAGLAAQTARADRAEEALRGHVATQLLGSDADVDDALRVLLATDLRAGGDARPASTDDRGGTAAAAPVRPAGPARSAGGG